MKALLLDQGLDRGSLAGARDLARDGWTVGVGSPFRGLAGSSRACSQWHRVPAAEDGVEEYVEAVAALVRTHGYEIVFTSDDIGIVALSLHRDRIGAVVPYADHACVLRSLDKLELARAAERAGVGFPVTVPAEDDALDVLGFPVVVKARLHSILLAGAPGRLDVTVCRDREEARRAVEAIRAEGGGPVLQECIVGPLVSIQAVVDRDFRLLSPMQQFSEHIWPAGAGGCARGRTVAIDRTLADGVARLMRELGWFGLAQLQFLQPSAGGPPRVIDLNGRFYSSMALASGSGHDLAAIWARLATDRPLCAERAARIGVNYQWLPGDLRAGLAGGGLRGALRSLALAPVSRHSVWSTADPWPAVRHYGAQIQGSVRRLIDAGRGRG